MLILKSFINQDLFNNMLAKAEITDDSSGLELLDKYFYLMDNYRDFSEIRHPIDSWANLLLLQGKFSLSSELFKIIYVYRCLKDALNWLAPGYKKTKPSVELFNTYLKNGKDKIFRDLWKIIPDIRIPCNYSMFEDMIDGWLNLEPSGVKWKDIKNEFPVFKAGSVLPQRIIMHEVCKKSLLSGVSRYETYIEKASQIQFYMANSCKKNLSGLSDSAKNYAASGTLFGVLLYALLSDNFEFVDQLDDQNVWEYFEVTSKRDQRKAYDELFGKGLMIVDNVKHSAIITKLWREGKSQPIRQRKKLITKIDKCIRDWIKVYYFESDGIAEPENFVWHPIIIRFLILADLEIESQETIDFFRTFKDIGNAFPCSRRLLERYDCIDTSPAELISFDEVAIRIYDRFVVDYDAPELPPLGRIKRDEREKAMQVYRNALKEFQVVRAKRLKEMQQQRELKRGEFPK